MSNTWTNYKSLFCDASYISLILKMIGIPLRDCSHAGGCLPSLIQKINSEIFLVAYLRGIHKRTIRPVLRIYKMFIIIMCTTEITAPVLLECQECGYQINVWDKDTENRMWQIMWEG